MKKVLRRLKGELFHTINGKKISGPNPDMYGNCSGLSAFFTWAYFSWKEDE